LKANLSTFLAAFGVLLFATLSLSSPSLFQSAGVFSSAYSGSSFSNPQTITYYYPEQICQLPGNNVSSSIFYSRTPDIKTTDPGVFLEDMNNGNVYWCSISNTGATGNLTLIATPPAGGRGGGYFGMGGFDTGLVNDVPNNTGVVLVMTSYQKHGMWFCYFASYQTCLKGESSFIPLPSSYCDSLKTKKCDPYGTALDGALNVYWVDPKNAVFTECTSASNYTDCFTLPGSSALAKTQPMGLALVNNTAPYLSPTPDWTFYITDYGCRGLVWEGNGTASSPLKVIAKIGDSLQGIGTTTQDNGHTQQLLVGDSGRCSNTPAKIIDLSANQTVLSSFQSPTAIMGISVCWGQCLQDKRGAWQLFYTASSSGTVWVSEAQKE
jgi:hypothetical protein